MTARDADASGDRPTLVLAAGGTGGHIYPALAIADAVGDRLPDVRVHAACSTRPLDAPIYDAAGVPSTAIRANPPTLRPRGLVRFVLGWGASVRAGRALLREQQAAAGSASNIAVLTTGGYAAAPVCQAARVEGVPVVLVCLDATPGKAARWIGRFADVAFAAAAGPTTPAAWERVPPIVRTGGVDESALDARAARSRLGLEPDRPLLLVTGGSQGARSINDLMAAFVRASGGALAGWQVLHQAGPGAADETLDELRAAYASADTPAAVVRYIDDMPAAWRGADAAVGRGGAGTIAEIWQSQTPALVLPYPGHRDQHQRWNAAPLEAAGGVVIHDDTADAARTLHAAEPSLRQLLTDAGRRGAMRSALAALGPADGAARVAQRLADMLDARSAPGRR